MLNKYIIDKIDIHDLITGKEIPLPQGKARAFCVEIAGKITNGDMIKALFPNMPRQMFWSIETEMNLASHYDWWNAPYKTESEGE